MPRYRCALSSPRCCDIVRGVSFFLNAMARLNISGPNDLDENDDLVAATNDKAFRDSDVTAISVRLF